MKGKMALAEIKRTPEKPRSIEEWVAQIKSNWENIPEFKVNPEKLKHLAIICDGNRRAAKEIRLNPFLGRQAGVEVIRLASRACRQWDIRTLTFWLWSTENWQRDKIQVEFIMNLFKKTLQDPQFLNEFCENQVNFRHLGRKDRFSKTIREGLETWEKKTAHFSRYQLNMALDYGGEDEIARSLIKINQEIKQNHLSVEKLAKNPKLIWQFLDTKNQHAVDLIIRTGTKSDEIPHTSGFMPLQSAYACWSFIPDLFPNLTPNSLLNHIKEFQGYQRRFGK